MFHNSNTYFPSHSVLFFFDLATSPMIDSAFKFYPQSGSINSLTPNSCTVLNPYVVTIQFRNFLWSHYISLCDILQVSMEC